MIMVNREVRKSVLAKVLLSNTNTLTKVDGMSRIYRIFGGSLSNLNHRAGLNVVCFTC